MAHATAAIAIDFLNIDTSNKILCIENS
jgi:hypothetical protein